MGLIWRFQSLCGIAHVYRSVGVNKTRFIAEYEEARARGDESVTLAGGALAPFKININSINTDFARALDDFMCKIRPCVSHYLLKETEPLHVTTSGLYANLMVKAERNDIDAELHFALATCVLNDGADETRQHVLAEHVAALARIKDEYTEYMSLFRSIFRDAVALALPTDD
jgi:hypothetical protein